MQHEAGRAPPPREGLHAALLDYARSPGRYPVAQRQPALLFDSIREILQIAIGRGDDKKPVQDAACFFIRSAMFYAGADHYAILGLTRDADAAALKDRYRMLMRLIHPDFSANDPGSWPADSAPRVNMAHDVLSSPGRRRDYDATLGAAPHRRIDLPRRARAGVTSRSGYKKIVVICGMAGGLVFGVLFMSGRDGVQLVQRRTVPNEPVAAPAPAPIVVATMAPLQLLFVAPPPPLPAPAVEIAMAPSPPPRSAIAPPPIVVVAAPVAPTVVAVAPPPPPPPPAPAPPPPAPPPPQPRPAPIPGLSLAEAQPLLAVLLQHLQSGRGDKLLGMLDREARSAPSAQALSRQIDGLGDGARPVKLSNVQFRAEPADGRLFVIGHMQVHAGEAGDSSAIGRKLALRVEFVSRGGAVAITGLSALAGN